MGRARGREEGKREREGQEGEGRTRGRGEGEREREGGKGWDDICSFSPALYYLCISYRTYL